MYGVGQHFMGVNNVSAEESELLRLYVRNLLTQNHTVQVRYRWSKNDLAIWDVRAVSCGEPPYFDPGSKSRRSELGAKLM